MQMSKIDYETRRIVRNMRNSRDALECLIEEDHASDGTLRAMHAVLARIKWMSNPARDNSAKPRVTIKQLRRAAGYISDNW
jgi:hypothetical protein